jgi:N-acetylneuraminic acid mutarotase
MHFRSAIFLLMPFIFICVSSASAQKRVFATVDPNAGTVNSDADIYDPVTGAMMPADNAMNAAREKHTAVRLHNGKILIAGGYNGNYLKSAEIYDPAAGTFEETEDMVYTRIGAAGVLLESGRILIAGGYNGYYMPYAELYDPWSGTFTMASDSMNGSRQNPTATLLQDGNVLITGGYNGTTGSETYYSTAELFDSESNSFNYTGSMTDGREGHTATLLADGRVLVTGGCNNSQSGKVVCDNFLASAELYDPEEESFTVTGSMSTPRMNHTATLLPSGKVLISGGSDGVSPLASAAIYNPDSGNFYNIDSMASARTGHTASILPDGKVLIAGGYSDHHLATAEVFDPGTESFTTLPDPMTAARLHHSATVLKDGKILIAGGQNSHQLIFDVNYQSQSDNIAPNIAVSPDSEVGFVPYTGSGVVLAFSTETGEVINLIETGGKPSFITPLLDGQRLAVASALDNKIYIINMENRSLQATYSFSGMFGFGSIPALSPDGNRGYISSTQTGEVIKFDIETGDELGKLEGLDAPAQITVTKDGTTLFIVDTGANEVVSADASSMTENYRIDLLNESANASLTIFNKVVLDQDETTAVIGSHNLESTGAASALFIFDVSSGEVLSTHSVGLNPGYTVLRPNGEDWLVLSQNAFTILPVEDPDSGVNLSTVQGSPLGSANIILTDDGNYAYYTSAIADQIYQHDIPHQTVVGAFLVGDDPNVSQDQASSLALTPDGKTMIVLNFASNQLELLSDTAVLKQTRFISQEDKFTGLSIVNLSDTASELTITALSETGNVFTGTDVVNPVTLQLEPNAQYSSDVSSLFNLDVDSDNTGRLVFESAQPVFAGYSTIGRLKASFLDPSITELKAIPLHHDYLDQLHNWIIPEIPRASDASTELIFVNPNYTDADLKLVHYGMEGTMIEENIQTLSGSYTETNTVSGIITDAQAGYVIIHGGLASTKTRNSAEYFDPVGKSFYSTSWYSKTPRHGHTAVLLMDEKILIAGGKNGFQILKSAELYDPVTGYFTATPGTMESERYRHTATMLVNGQVLLAGGQNSSSINSSAELYDPVTGSFAATAEPMTIPRDAHTATRLPNGKVLLAGGIDGIGISATAELYDPASSSFLPAGSMNEARAFHTAVLLPNGKVFIAGGYNGSYLSSAELYDPSTGSFSLICPMTDERSRHTATLMSDGTVLVAGGKNASGPLNTAEIYDPESAAFLPTENTMSSARSSHTATLLDNDAEGTDDFVLIAGGFGYSDEDDEDDEDLDTLYASEYFDPVSRQFIKTSTGLLKNRQEHTATLLSTGMQGYFRGTSGSGMLFTEIYSNGGASTTINGINLDKYAGITRICSPQFAVSSNYVTFLNVINGNQDSEAEITLTLHAPDGTILATPVTRILPINAQLKGDLHVIFQNHPDLQDKTGWLEITSSVDYVVGALSLTNLEESFLVSFELSGAPMRDFIFPFVSEDSEFMTGIALLNGGNQPANVEIELWGASGTLDAYRTITLAPGTRIAEVLSQLLPEMEPHRLGNVRVHSDQPLYGMGTVFDQRLTFISSVPPVSFPEP